MIRWVKLRSYNSNLFQKSATTFKTDIFLLIYVVAERIDYQYQSLHDATMWFDILAVSKGPLRDDLMWVK